jgi:V/A-type H+-transporting ATPase subunit C
MATVHKHSIIYSLGRVKELEKGLLTATNLDRVLEAEEPSAVLRSIGFFKAAEEYGEHESLETIFVRERVHNRRLLHELISESPLEDIFLLPYDIQNIKLLLKGKLASNPAVKDMALEEGKFSKAELVKAIYDEAPTEIPAPIIADLKWITVEFQDNQRFALADYQLDRRLRLLQLDIARKAKNRFMIEYLQRLSDLQNIAGTFRRKFHLLESDSLSETLLDTGTLAPSFFERIYGTGWESIVNTFKPTEYGHAVTKALAQVEQPYFLAWLDVCCTGYVLEYLRKTKQISFGIEPLLAFYLAREHELKIVRTIWIGKQFEYTPDKLKLRLRELY